MRPTLPMISAVLLGAIALASCSESADQTGAIVAPSTPRKHVGYKGLDVPLGFVSNSAECHIGKKGNRWPLAEQYEVKSFDAHLTVSPIGAMTLVCRGEIPSNQPLPQAAEVEEAVLCFLPNQRETRHAQELFTPGGQIILTCQLNPNND